jgi:nucleotide-binding universal stress UspA family protein
MTQFQNILCPVDFSDPSRKALRHAAALARRYGSDLTVLYVEDVLLAAARSEVNRHAATVRSPEEDLRTFVNGAGVEAANVNVRSAAGNVVDRILDHARDRQSDLIVIGTRGRSGVARAILGSVADRVLRQAECPVMTVPPTGEDVAGKLDATFFNPILCASDFSASCKKALDVGLWVGEQEGARVILLNVMQWPTSLPTAGVPPATINALPTRRELEWEARERLVAALPTDTSHRYRPEVMVESGRPSDVILRIAVDEAVTLIVMGVTSRGAFDQMIFGSTIRSVIQAAHCPVLSVRADAYDARWPRAAGEPTDLVALRSEN